MASDFELLDMLYNELHNSKIITCNCGKNTYDNDEDGIKSCKECGYISINNIDLSTEENEAYISNSSMHSNVENASLGTNICGSSYLSKINSWGIWMNNYKEKTFLDIIEVIKSHCLNKIPKIIVASPWSQQILLSIQVKTNGTRCSAVQLVSSDFCCCSNKN